MRTKLTNPALKTRQKFKEAYDIHFAAVIERSEKEALLAKQARRLVNLVDDTPIVPGNSHQAFDGNEKARLILDNAEEDLKNWHPTHEVIRSNASSMAAGAMPGVSTTETSSSTEGVQALPNTNDTSTSVASTAGATTGASTVGITTESGVRIEGS